jgi:hypothetical protein
MLSLIPRLVAFDENGKAICTGCPANLYSNTQTIRLPTDHYDFAGPVNVQGKTKEQIEREVANLMLDQFAVQH